MIKINYENSPMFLIDIWENKSEYNRYVLSETKVNVNVKCKGIINYVNYLFHNEGDSADVKIDQFKADCEYIENLQENIDDIVRHSPRLCNFSQVDLKIRSIISSFVSKWSLKLDEEK